MTALIENDIALAEKIARSVSEEGGAVYYVGGFVRDRVMGIPVKDVDIEVHRIYPETLKRILSEYGELLEIGASFGVYGIKGCGIDIAMPRIERATGKNHRDFAVDVDPFAGTLKAAQRRDFTVNAMMQNVLTGEITDHFNGLSDIESKTLHFVNSETFSEDSLRVLRGAQFAARYGFHIDEETRELCESMDLSSLSPERVMGELEKALLKSQKPSVFFEELRKMNQLDVWFPEIKNMLDVEQDVKFHSEGDVWNHTMRVLDKGAAYRKNVENPRGFMLAALLHDVGKPLCTCKLNGVIHAYGHETEGIPLAEQFMNRITAEKELIKYVINMVELHMRPNTMVAHKSAVKSTNKMFDKSVAPQDLIYLALSDGEASLGWKPYDTDESRPFLTERLRIYRETMEKPYVTGKDLLEAGFEPGTDFGEILDYAHKLRLAGIDKENALKQTVAFAGKINKKAGAGNEKNNR